MTSYLLSPANQAPSKPGSTLKGKTLVSLQFAPRWEHFLSIWSITISRRAEGGVGGGLVKVASLKGVSFRLHLIFEDSARVRISVLRVRVERCFPKKAKYQMEQCKFLISLSCVIDEYTEQLEYVMFYKSV